jgi:acyl CoA:acetate/3-ketoacid CoA transferase alpha subunit/acyl CoA:acetate/3-ketoacid CoA transferase beta subunit
VTPAAGQSKVMSVAEAVERFVSPGATIHLAYGGARPNAAVAEIVRRYAGTDPRFTVSAHGFVSTQHALVAAGLVSHLCVAFAGENYPSPRPSPVLQRALAGGTVTIENWSIWTLTARLAAGALGVEAFPVRSLAASGIAAEHAGGSYRPGEGPDRDGSVAALRPDVVLLQAVAADEAGNVVLAAPYGEGRWGALAARTGVIACVEAIVPPEVLRRYNSWPQLPAHVVRAVCHAPRGSHPYGLWAGGFPGVDSYVEDGPFMAEVRRAARDPGTFDAWVREWMTEPADHADYLRRLDARPDPPAPRPAPRKTDATPNERMTVAAARLIERRVRAAGYDSVLAGIGFAHLASWAACRRLRRAGTTVELLAELGMAGIEPADGDPYLFASQNFPGCGQLTDVAEVLGTMPGPATRCLGVLGAGQVDAAGNLNSTWSDDGRFLVGSGGANDVASTADEVIVVVRQDAARLVPEAGYVTAPGARVSTIVTTEAIFERRAGRFVVTGWLLEPGLSRPEIRDRLQAGTGWAVELADTVDEIPPPSADELSALRAFDPQSIFLQG